MKLRLNEIARPEADHADPKDPRHFELVLRFSARPSDQVMIYVGDVVRLFIGGWPKWPK